MNKVLSVKHRQSAAKTILSFSLLAGAPAFAATSVSQFGITWTFNTNYTTGQYANGDYWVVGPVTITSITNNLRIVTMATNILDGSMINPNGSDDIHGYDGRVKGYTKSLNAGRPGGNPVSADNPLVLPVNSSLISSASWATNEPGCPIVTGGIYRDAPRPAIHSMAILTCVSNAPSAGSFRPPYCGTNKASFNKSQLDYSKLANLSPVASTPDLATVEGYFVGPWVDHVTKVNGRHLHPSMHMPDYGRDMSKLIGTAALMLNLDFTQLPGNPSKETLLVRFVQMGIDWAGIADTGGNWYAAGGHFQGRKWPILFAGVMLNDTHMKDVGNWATVFQEDQGTFYVSQAEVDMTHSAKWNPDKRNVKLGHILAYTNENIGLPEWGIRAKTEDNLHWNAVYRFICSSSYPGWVLAAHIMGQRTAWNHEALFDYIDRSTSLIDTTYHVGPTDRWGGSAFNKAMWETYRVNYPPRWIPDNPTNFYGAGRQVTNNQP